MTDSLHEITIAASPARVFELLTTTAGISAWWTDDTIAEPEVGHVNQFRFNAGAVVLKFRVEASESPRRVRWSCEDATPSMGEWKGTQISADLEATEGGTRLRFAHRGWVSSEGAYALCNATWGALMFRLKDAAEERGPGPLFGAKPLDVARRYYEAWRNGGQGLDAVLSPTLKFVGPIDRFDRAADFIDVVRRLAPVVSDFQMLTQLQQGPWALSLYDFVTTTPAGTLRCAEVMRVADGRIAEIQLYFDPRRLLDVMAASAPNA